MRVLRSADSVKTDAAYGTRHLQAKQVKPSSEVGCKRDRAVHSPYVAKSIIIQQANTTGSVRELYSKPCR